MDPNIQNIILGIVANGLTELIAYFGRRGRDFIIGKEMIEKMKRERAALQPILQRAADAVAESIEWDGPSRLEEVCLFLTSPEVEKIIRQIYSTKLSEDKGQNLELIRKEFLTTFSFFIGIEKERLANPANLVFDALIGECEHALNIAIDEGVLSAHEAKSTLRHRILLDELTAIQKNLGILVGKQKQDIEAILEFEEKYRLQIGSRHGTIIPPHFDVARRLPIDAIYVSPNFITTPQKKGEEPHLLKSSDFLSMIYRAVILGTPGAGKSTFILKLCHELATYYSERLFAGREVTPILVILRDYGAEKKAHNCSFLQFIEAMANSKYQVQPPPGAFEYLLLSGRVLVVFDGLDELLDSSYRQEISYDIESFCTLYPAVPIIVTSREVGYEQAPLDENNFEIFHLAPFDDDQVREYVKKWFTADADLTSEQQNQKVEALFDESQIVPDLRSNPLMLALMCNIYRGENYIPRNRPDVYEKCAVMLFERWDKSRGIHVPLPFEAHIRPAMMYLAHWIYEEEALQGGVTEESLVLKATDYLSMRRFEDRDEAEKAAREFIEFCRGRAWVFTDTGTMKEGERLYQFTHRTFLEYFTAAHLVRIYPTPDRLGNVLLPKIAKREWDVVAQLAFQIQNKNVDGAGDELLTMLIDQSNRTGNEEGWNLLSFAARCLEFMIPRPKISRDITLTCIQRCVDWGSDRVRQKKSPKPTSLPAEPSKPEEILGALFNAAAENRTAIAGSLEKFLVEKISSGDESEALLALEIARYFHIFLFRRNRMWRHKPDEEGLEYWGNISRHIFDACSSRVEKLCEKYFNPCYDALRSRRITMQNFIKWHGITGLFRPYSFTMSPILFGSIAEGLMDYHLLNLSYPPDQRKRIEFSLNRLREIGSILLSSPTPWVKGGTPSFVSVRLFAEKGRMSRGEGEEGELLSLDSDVLFGIFALISAMLEGNEKRRIRMVDNIKKSSTPLWGLIRWIFLGRFEEVDPDKIYDEIKRCKFNAEQQAFIWRWIRREVDLVEHRKHNNNSQRE